MATDTSATCTDAPAGRKRGDWLQEIRKGDRSGRPGLTRLRAWMRLLFPAVFLVYLLQTGGGVVKHTNGGMTVLGMVILAAFCLCYLAAVVDGTDGRYGRFDVWYGLLIAFSVAEMFFAHEDALPMLVYVAVLTVASRFNRAFPVLVVFVATPLVLPHFIGSWHVGPQTATAVSIAIVSLAMFSFFGVIRANAALEEARAEVARLAAEGERTRIARDLHDLLGHSLTTITVKAGLAHRLVAREPDRARQEMAEVEGLARRALADVRATVSGYRETTLSNELATAREVLRAAGISAIMPTAIDSIGLPASELFAWVVREGVTNVVRHSRATRCEIRLGPTFVEISDDGVGSGGQSGDGAGLVGLGERVREAGGTLSNGPGRAGRAGRADDADGADGPGFVLRAEVDR